MEQKRLNLYTVNMKYIRNLHNQGDDRVFSVSPQVGKENRPFYMKKIHIAIIFMCLLSLFGCTAYSGEKPAELPPALPACVYYNGNLYSHVGDVIYFLPEKAELIGETNNVGSEMKSDLDSTVNGYVYTIPDNSTELLFQWKEWDEQVDGKEPFLVLHSTSENESVSTGLFASATPSRSVISMSYYDGTEGVQGFFSDLDDEEEYCSFIKQS